MHGKRGLTAAGYALSLTLATVMLLAVVWQADPEMLAAGLTGPDWGLLAAVPALYLVVLAVRAARFRMLLEPDGPWGNWYRLTALHNFYFTFVPFKLGEAFLLPLVRGRGVPMTDAAMALAWSRSFELMIILLFGVVGMLGMGLGSSVLPVAVLFAFLVLLLLRMRWVSDRLARMARSLCDRTGWGWASRLAVAFESGNARLIAHRGLHARFLLLTLGVCLSAGLCLAFCLAALGYWLGPTELLFLFAGLSLLGVLGIFTVAGLGVSDLGLAGLLMLVGFGLVEATSVALLARFFLLATTLLGTGIVILITGSPGGRFDE